MLVPASSRSQGEAAGWREPGALGFLSKKRSLGKETEVTVVHPD